MAPRVHVVPFLRGPGGRVLIPDWLAITVGRDIFAWRALDPAELAHEVEHVRQWRQYGIGYAPRYFVASYRAWRGGGRWYWDNAFEAAAREAAARDAAARERAVG